MVTQVSQHSFLSFLHAVSHMRQLGLCATRIKPFREGRQPSWAPARVPGPPWRFRGLLMVLFPESSFEASTGGRL